MVLSLELTGTVETNSRLIFTSCMESTWNLAWKKKTSFYSFHVYSLSNTLRNSCFIDPLFSRFFSGDTLENILFLDLLSLLITSSGSIVPLT